MDESVNTASRRRGISIIEVLISLLILSIVIGSVFVGLIQARHLTRATAHQANALQIARSNIEALRHSYGYADPFLSVTATNASHTNMPSDLPTILTVGNLSVGITYTPSYQVKETTLPGGTKYKTVNFLVSWYEPTFKGSNKLTVCTDTIIASVLDR